MVHEPDDGAASPMARQGELTQELAAHLMDTLPVGSDWDALHVAIIPDGAGWVGRIVAEQGGQAVGGGARFAEGTTAARLVDDLQQATYAVGGCGLLSLQLDLARHREEGGRATVSAGTRINYDEDPGSFDGVGGIDGAWAARFLERFPAAGERLPGWLAERAGRVG